MFKFFLFSAALLSAGATPTGQPSGEPSGEPSSAPTSTNGVSNLDYDGSSYAASNDQTTSTLTILDPIGTSKDTIKVDIDHDSVTYVGLFDSTLSAPLSHTEGAVGGPITKVACNNTAGGPAPAGDNCPLPLYRGGNVLDPVPAATYKLWAVNGNDLDYASAIALGGLAQNYEVVVNPYISAWGSTLAQTTNPSIERGDAILVSWDGLGAGDYIEFRRTSGTIETGFDCPVDFYNVTEADVAAGARTTISLQTSASGKLNSFAIPGTYSINIYGAEDSGFDTLPSYASLADADCAISGGGAAATWVSRTVTITESDTLTIDGHLAGVKTTGVESGSVLNMTYNVGSAITSGTYVGLWKVGANPSSHIVDPDFTAGRPLAASFLPVGVSGVGTIELQIPLSAGTEEDYYVGMFNNNDAYAAALSPLALHSWNALGRAGPADQTSVVAFDTDLEIVAAPTGQPTGEPSGEPSGEPTSMPTAPTGEPTSIPTSSPSFVEEPWGEYVWTEKRHRKAGMCENQCSGHGTCEVNGNCQCFKGLDGEDEWTGPDCSSRTCPFDFAWVGASINANNLHPWAECSNKGICDRSSGECQCFVGYEGAACQRTVCPDNCNDQGTCWPEKHLASKAGRVYDAPWDAMKHVGCLCDAGYRGPACDQQECPSGADPLSGYGNEAGRDCSGRGICDYSNGICACFTGFFGTRCQHQTTVM